MACVSKTFLNTKLLLSKSKFWPLVLKKELTSQDPMQKKHMKHLIYGLSADLWTYVRIDSQTVCDVKMNWQENCSQLQKNWNFFVLLYTINIGTQKWICSQQRKQTVLILLCRHYSQMEKIQNANKCSQIHFFFSLLKRVITDLKNTWSSCALLEKAQRTFSFQNQCSS